MFQKISDDIFEVSIFKQVNIDSINVCVIYVAVTDWLCRKPDNTSWYLPMPMESLLLSSCENTWISLLADTENTYPIH